MSGISFIRRDYGDCVSIVRILTSDLLSTALAPGYLTAQAANISATNYGPFQWLTNDVVLVYAADGWTFASVNAGFTSLVPQGWEQSTTVNLTSTQFEALYATPLLLVPAPNAGTVNVISKMLVTLNFGTTQYTAGGALGAQYGNSTHGAGEAASATLAAATINAAVASTIYEIAGVSSILVSGAEGDGIYLSNTGAAFATGDSTFQVTTYFHNVAA
jgi:hypothetical protein